LSRWQREIDSQGQQTLSGSGHARDEEVARLKRELACFKKERVFYAKRQRSFSATILRKIPVVSGQMQSA
jgi:transposase